MALLYMCIYWKVTCQALSEVGCGLDGRGHKTGQLMKITYARTYWGGVNRKQGHQCGGL